jgi:hypothetical protein
VQTHYDTPVAHPPVFDEIKKLSPIMDDTGFSSLGDLTIKMNGGTPNDTLGLRQSYWDITHKVDRKLYSFLVDTFYAQLPDILDVEGLAPYISIQAITAGQLKGMQKNGGNALGLDPTKGPYFVMNMSAWWKKASDDAKILKFLSTITSKIKAYAKSRGVDNDYIYMNYASQFQDPLGSYGAANLAKLIAVSKKYDPTQVFQTLHPGYFKLGQGAPNPSMP